MQTVYFVYADIWSYESWDLKGLFTDEKLARRHMLRCAKQEYEEEKSYLVGEGKPVPSFRDFVAKGFKVVSKLLVDTAEDEQKLVCRSYVVDLATGKAEQTYYSLDFEENSHSRLEAEPHFMGSEKIAIEDDTLDCVWTCGNTEQEALDKLKKWLKQMTSYPKDVVTPHKSLLE